MGTVFSLFPPNVEDTQANPAKILATYGSDKGQ